MSDRLPNSIDHHVASRLRLRRQEMGLSQETVAYALGVTFQQFQKYEQSVNRISAGALYKLARALEVPVTYFFEGLRDPEKKRRARPLQSESGKYLRKPHDKARGA